jgi:hypothetical protein
MSGQGEAMTWIISRRDDLLWFHGSVVAGVALGAAFALGVPALPLLLAWGVFFDGTHVWGTYARSYLAPADERRALPGHASWALLLVGPAAALAGRAPFSAFLLFAYAWAYYHLVRQHWGFVALYRRRAGETAPSLDQALLWIGCLYPFVRFGLSDAYTVSGLPLLFPDAWRPVLGALVDGAALVAIGFVGAAWARDPRPTRLGPKHLYLAIVIAFHLAVFALLRDLLAIMATLTIFHDLQYHRIVWRYERAHGRTPSLGRYLAAGLVLGVAWYLPRVVGVAVTVGLARDLLIGLGWGVAFHHYLVDGRIWKGARV